MKERALRLLGLLGILLVVGAAGLGCSSDGGGTDTDLDVPEVLSVNPADGTVHVNPGGTITVEFSINMDQASVEAATTLSDPTRSNVSYSTNWIGNIVEIEPDAPLAAGVLYTLTIGTGAKSDEGEPLAEAFTSSFTTLPNHPVVLSTSPADEATGVAINAGVHILFSMDMDEASTVAALSVDPSVAFTAGVENNALDLDFNADLAANTTYTITVAASAEAAGGGSTLGEDYVFAFTTGSGADTTPPTIVSWSPANGAAHVSVDIGELVITFSEPILEGPDPEAIDLRLYALVYMEPTLSPDGTQMTVPLLRLPAGCTIWADLGPFQDTAGNLSANPPLYSFTTAGTADLFPAELDDWWEYRGDYDDEVQYLIRTANVFAGDFDLNRYKRDIPGRQPDDYTVLDHIDHYSREGDDLFWDGSNELHGDIWTDFAFEPPVNWLHFPLVVGQDWGGNSTFEADGSPARVSYSAEVTAIIDYSPDLGRQGSRSVWPLGEARQLTSLVFPDCAQVTLSYEMEIYREGAWLLAEEASEVSLYCPGLGLVNSHIEGTSYGEGGAEPYVENDFLLSWLVGQ